MRLNEPVPASLFGRHEQVAQARGRGRRGVAEGEDEGAELLLARRGGIDVVGLGHDAVHLEAALREHLPDRLRGLGVAREAVVRGVDGDAETLREAGIGEELLGARRRRRRSGFSEGSAPREPSGTIWPAGSPAPSRMRSTMSCRLMSFESAWRTRTSFSGLGFKRLAVGADDERALVAARIEGEIDDAGRGDRRELDALDRLTGS